MYYYTLAEARDINEEYEKLFKVTNKRMAHTLPRLVPGDALNDECDRMIGEIEAYHNAIMDNLPDDEQNTR